MRFASIDIPSIFDYLHPDEYSYRRVQQCIHLQIYEAGIWQQVVRKRKEERTATAEGLRSDKIPAYQSQGFHPGILLQSVLDRTPALLGPYGECLEASGSLWAFLGAVV